MRSDNMPRPFAPEHGEETPPDLQRDIDEIDRFVSQCGWQSKREAWQRIRARLTPDREGVAAGLRKKCLLLGLSDEVWLELADAAIAAMKETP